MKEWKRQRMMNYCLVYSNNLNSLNVVAAVVVVAVDGDVLVEEVMAAVNVNYCEAAVMEAVTVNETILNCVSTI